jgi:hypothetical protein
MLSFLLNEVKDHFGHNVMSSPRILVTSLKSVVTMNSMLNDLAHLDCHGKVNSKENHSQGL